MISRRAFLIRVAILVTPLEVIAQQRNAVPRVGVLAQDIQPGLLETFRDELQRLGSFEGKGIVTEVRNAEGRSDRLPPLVADLLRLKVDVIVAVNTPAAKAAQNAAKTVPIVIMRVADPVKAGLVRSLAYPGANVTGVSFMPDVLGAKAIEALSQTIPTLSRVAAFYKADNPGALLVETETERRSAELRVRFERLPTRDSSDFPDAFAAAAPCWRSGGVRHGRRRDDKHARAIPEARVTALAARCFDLQGFCGGWRPVRIRARSRPRLPTRGALRGSPPQGHETK
jgi:putative ABC transport system substrate-binding protein